MLALDMAVAQPMPPTHVGAFVRWHQGNDALQRGQVDEAIRLYRDAASQGAPGGVYRSLALALEHGSRWREASEAWVHYSALADRPVDRDDAMARAESLRRMLTAMRVRVVPGIAARTARVWFDRDPPRWYQAGGVEQVSDGGSHRIRVESPGYGVWEQMVVTGFGEARDVVVTLSPVPSGDQANASTRDAGGAR